jgi:nitronate monooxygenase
MLLTPLTREWGLRHPLVLAPMAGVSGGRLAAAVVAAGGLGLVGVGESASTGWLDRQAAEARAAGPGWGFGCVAWVLERNPGLLEHMLRLRPPVVALSFGDVAPWARQVRDAGARLVVQVRTRGDALTALAAGADALVAQGTEAGGHTGFIGTLTILQVVLDVIGERPVPVLAAGGVATGAAVAGTLVMGAAGAWIGSALSAAHEADGSPARKERLLRAAETDTVQTRVFDIALGAGYPNETPGRALRNRFTGQWHGKEADLAARLPAENERLRRARAADDLDTYHVYAGQAIGLVRAVEPAGAIIGRLAAQAEAAIRGSGALLGHDRPG